MAGKSVLELKDLLRYRKKERGSVTHIANRLGQPNLITPDWLILTAKDMMPKPEHVSFPKPPKAPGIVYIVFFSNYSVYSGVAIGGPCTGVTRLSGPSASDQQSINWNY